MREIKFRIWDKEQKKMYDLGYLADCLYTTKFSENFGRDLTKYEIMQYTGLKDKNGKEIYEGDLLNCRGEDEPYEVAFGVKKFINHIHHVKDIREVFSDYNISNMLAAGFEIEIIGNIYENSELLKPS